MFFIKSNDPFLSNTIINVLNQKAPYFTDNNQINSFATISISFNEKTFFIEIGNEKKCNNTFHVHKTFEKLDSILIKIEILFHELIYIPIKQNLIYQNKSLVLGNIHNLIFSALLLHQKSGVNKSLLYGKIWPNDKDFHINKLDTHLTNLKNLINKKLEIKINFKTVDGKIYLISD